MAIHQTAIVDSKAELDPSVEVGAYTIIEGRVKIGANSHISHHVYLLDYTELAANVTIHSHAVIGDTPQDRNFENKPSYVKIGGGTTIREGVTIHRGSKEGSITSIGANCLLMGQSHVAHNCEVSDDVILANQVMLAGHVSVGRGAFFSAHAMAHQFVRIGANVMVSGAGLMTQDVPHFLTAAHRNEAVGVNIVGMKRKGYSREEISEVRRLFRLLTRRGGQSQRECMEIAQASITTAAGRMFADFFNQESRRGVIACRKRDRQATLDSVQSDNEADLD